MYTYCHTLSREDVLPSSPVSHPPVYRWAASPACHRASALCRPACGAGSCRASAETCPCALSFLGRSEEHTSELQSLMRISYAVFCLKTKKLVWQVKLSPEDSINVRPEQKQNTQQH